MFRLFIPGIAVDAAWSGDKLAEEKWLNGSTHPSRHPAEREEQLPVVYWMEACDDGQEQFCG
ncbi:hypothetical protein PHISP_01625 [Aspergillus sp. HF37]|nr:hypothetical protein PHISP_01625 [Aspergillus sp. HF37]